MSKKCIDCKFFDESKSYCFLTDDPVDIPATSNACPDFKQRTQILFDHIIASPEVLAEKLVYDWGHLCHNGDIKIYWKSTILPDAVFGSKVEALTATVAKLKEVCNAESN